ncbi:hemerythrin domain-containing protein [Ornithinimicrobium pratense]|uniref:Hemerythrin domain-containing protein n=1 Tax=Ornithinimicrobium pratense TaxID=2593973 RepID=A0A5J6V2E4_9MICO|nr:hemerythrin domain-containing protein [Ornithinimicrobium pratense]QFG68080.1 hemerythrin domain-containing protein [Ornithinimicrobium pratense]
MSQIPAPEGRPRPAGQARGPCDASGMEDIHRMFRAGFGEGSQLVPSVADGDVAHADRVGDHLAMLSTMLHAHHEFEDENLWDRLSERAPACALHVDRMKDQHSTMLVHLRELDAALPAWRSSGRTSDALPVQEALAGINAALAAHLPDEEEHIVPVMERVLTQREINEAAVHGRRATPKGKTFAMLGAILAAQPDGGAAWARKHLPLPVRLVWRTIGRSRYEAGRAALRRREPGARGG